MKLKDLVQWALDEDMPNGDLTTDSLGVAEHFGRARLVAKEDLILSGVEAFEMAFRLIDSNIQIQWQFKEGELALKGQNLASLKGNLVSMLKSERVALNFIGHLSGVATYTKCFTQILEGSKTWILDTRKTLPLLRYLEKQAVVHGGGKNHRMNLSEAVMIKDNHIRLAGGVSQAVEKLRQNTEVPITLECSTLEEVEEAIRLRVDRILLDNMSNELMKACLEKIPPTIETEASGNMNLERLRQIAHLGLTFVSIGALTHSAPCADISLGFEWEN